jgi:AraC-like DNA-binding protein
MARDDKIHNQGRVLTGDCRVRVQFHQPPAALRRFFTTFYLTEIDVPEGTRVTDHLHPEWANIRIFSGDLPVAEIAGEPPHSNMREIATGPTSTTIRFSIGAARSWGIGLLPLGWAKFVAVPANRLADSLLDARLEPAFARFVPLLDTLFGPEPDEPAELARIEAHFQSRLGEPLVDEARIEACHAALVDTEVWTVSDMARRAGMPPHTLERLCRRHFGFTPSLLLRRQRFMRSLAQYMLDPTLKWVGAMDGHYHDQAQFVRDFHRFMGMGPREYAALPHPILSAVMHARMAAAGAAVQALHLPQTVQEPHRI